VLLSFRQEDISQNLVVMSLSQWLWESGFYTNKCCFSSSHLQITQRAAAHSDFTKFLRWRQVSD